MTEFTFANESDAREACQELNRIGSQRNITTTVAFREGCRVYLRPEYTSKFLMEEFSKISNAF